MPTAAEPQTLGWQRLRQPDRCTQSAQLPIITHPRTHRMAAAQIRIYSRVLAAGSRWSATHQKGNSEGRQPWVSHDGAGRGGAVSWCDVVIADVS